MKIADIKTTLHNEIDKSDDRLLKIIYAIVQEYRSEDSDDTDALRKKLVLQERESYLRDEGKSYSWDEVKKMAINKQRPDEL